MFTHVLLIEGDADLRSAIVRYLLGHGDRVTVCDSIATAVAALAEVTPATAPDAIMSGAILADGEGVGFFLGMSRRFPEMRWILTVIDREPVKKFAAGTSGPRARVRRKAIR